MPFLVCVLAIVSQLERAADGLLFMSESDHPFEVVHWKRPGGDITAERIAQLTGHVGETVEEKTVEAFFRHHTSPRHRKLVKVLRKKLSSIRVYRFGVIEIHSYVVGVTRHGSWAGLATIQIET